MDNFLCFLPFLRDLYFRGKGKEMVRNLFLCFLPFLRVFYFRGKGKETVRNNFPMFPTFATSLKVSANTQR